MSVIVWDNPQDRTYESGLDRGVLYPQDSPAVPWNGLTSIVEKFDAERKAIYYDGMKINDLVELGDFAATLKAITYPDELNTLEGMGQAAPGMFLGNQATKSFGLTYRTKIGNAVEGNDAGYKIHILYNLIALPSDRSYDTQTDSPSLTEFEWDISAVPEEVIGFRPTAHIIIDSTTFDPAFLSLIEDRLYGTISADAELIPMYELIVFLLSWFNVVVVDNGNGTWTAYSSQPVISNPITFPATGEFAISAVAGSFLDANTYQISSTP